MEKQPFIKQGWVRATLFIMAFLLMVMLFYYAAGVVTSKLAMGKASDTAGKAEGRYILISFLVSFISSVLTVFLFRKYIDRQSLKSLGISIDNHRSHAAAGLCLGILLLGLGSLILIANSNLVWTRISFDANQLFINLVLMLLVAFAEELVFRGYVLNNLLQSMNKWLALLVSALVFALFHRNNPGVTPVALVNVFIAGLMLGVNYLFTRNLWFGILLHFSWNFYQGSILGYKVSGLNLQSVLQQELSGSPLLTGGNFGFEGSLLDGVLTLTAFLLLAWLYEKKYNVKGAHLP